jgi:hypothetical protein
MNIVYSKSLSSLSVGSSVIDLFEQVPQDTEDNKKATPLPKKQMFMILLVTFIGKISN